MNSKAERTKNMRYKRPALASLGYDLMMSELWEINDACGEVQYFTETDDETLLNALDGDDEAEYEFRIAFSDLTGKIEQLFNCLEDRDVREYYDDCTVGLIGNRYKTVGYDMDEEDYFSLTSYEENLAYTLSGERLMRKTKQEMISVIGQCLGIVIAFLDIRQSYDYLKATFDILRDENTSLLQTIKEIDAAYKTASEEGFYDWGKETKRFEILIANLPDRLWIE
jgi:hypothetical protein